MDTDCRPEAVGQRTTCGHRLQARSSRSKDNVWTQDPRPEAGQRTMEGHRTPGQKQKVKGQRKDTGLYARSRRSKDTGLQARSSRSKDNGRTQDSRPEAGQRTTEVHRTPCQKQKVKGQWKDTGLQARSRRSKDNGRTQDSRPAAEGQRTQDSRPEAVGQNTTGGKR